LLKVLARDNTTLIKFQIVKNEIPISLDLVRSEGIQELLYWLKLNEFGRRAARDNSTSKADFVDLLCVACDPSNKQYSSLDKFNVCFGLLQETPSTWCSDPMAPHPSVACGKRKRGKY
jgi:hypothetical protein